MSTSRFPLIRDIALLVSGLLLLGYETVFVPEPRVAIITVAAAMLGLPASLLADRKFVKGGGDSPDPKTPTEVEAEPSKPDGKP